jgi:hypothetical protein
MRAVEHHSDPSDQGAAPYLVVVFEWALSIINQRKAVYAPYHRAGQCENRQRGAGLVIDTGVIDGTLGALDQRLQAGAEQTDPAYMRAFRATHDVSGLDAQSARIIGAGLGRRGRLLAYGWRVRSECKEKGKSRRGA